MTAIDLEKLSLDELKQLEKDVSKAVRTFETRRKKEALAAAEAAAREKGFSLAELTSGSKTVKTIATPKYRHPENPELTWSGRGRKPAWFNAALNAGKSLEDLSIDG
ncbi:H-NS histone family protein [Chachezhania sediminis]|uniref:H-NS histone family protein n=1 Tax=Chachezhania sediminis TaxID=2599291 RepID=UPI00131E008E|nr:H-NS histone family protein [Chachezhania sediminis]